MARDVRVAEICQAGRAIRYELLRRVKFGNPAGLAVRAYPWIGTAAQEN